MTAEFLSEFLNVESFFLSTRKWKSKFIMFVVFRSFFLEKNMLSFFLRIMKQKCGSYVCVQLLQTLNILFENIRNETSLCKLQINRENFLYFF